MTGIILITVFLVLILIILTGYYIHLFLKPHKLKTIERMMKIGNSKEAIKNLKKILTKDSGNYEARKLLADAYYLQKQDAQAISEYQIAEKYTEEMPSEWEVALRSNFADVLYRKERMKEALREYITLTKINSLQKVRIFQRIGGIYYQFKAFDQAALYYRETIKRDVTVYDAHLGLGKSLYQLKQYKEALIQFQKSIKLGSEDSEPYYWVGKCYQNLGELNRAIEAFAFEQKDKAIRAKTLIEKAICYNQTGFENQTISELTTILRSDRFTPEAEMTLRYHLAEAYESKNNVIAAIKHWELINAKNPNFREVSKKLFQYNSFRASDAIKDYITVSVEDFTAICEKLILRLSYVTHEVKSVSKEEVIIIAREEFKLITGKITFKLVIFARFIHPLSERQIRAYLPLIKRYNCSLCIVVSVSNFSPLSVDFSRSRPLTLIGPDRLNQLLQGK